MIRLLLTFLITLPAAWSMGQVIHGTVLDKESGKPVDYADVFFDGTFLGTITDEHGVFTLDVTRYSSRSLTISAMGYYPGSLSEFTAGKNYRVYLTPRVFAIEEAMVSAKSLTRERLANLKLFRNEFIGSTRYAKRCYILNEKDITFNYGTDQDTLKAYASKPIRIQNLALGYEISYYLDRFEYDRHTKTVVYTGSIIFLKVVEQICGDPVVDSLDFSFGDAQHKQVGDSRQWAEASVFIFAPRLFPVFVNLILSMTSAISILTQQFITKLGIRNLVQRYRRKRILEKSKK